MSKIILLLFAKKAYPALLNLVCCSKGPSVKQEVGSPGEFHKARGLVKLLSSMA